MTAQKWVRSSLRTLSAKLEAAGHAVSPPTVSRLLRKLEMPELKVEDAKDEELRIAPEPGSGAGYDPYNQAVKPPKKPGAK